MKFVLIACWKMYSERFLLFPTSNCMFLVYLSAAGVTKSVQGDLDLDGKATLSRPKKAVSTCCKSSVK